MKIPALMRSSAFVLTCALLAVTAVGMEVLPRYMNYYLRKLPVDPRKHMREVSKSLPSWSQVGHDRQEAEDILKALGTNNTITRYYTERNPPAGEPPIVLELHLAYYTGMVDTVPHVSDRCMIGGGWQPLTGSVDTAVALDPSSWRRVEGRPEGMPESLTEARLPVSPEFTTAPGSKVVLPYDLVAADARDSMANDKVTMRISDFVDPKTQAVSIIGHVFVANNRLTPSANMVRQLAFNLEDDYAYYAKIQVSISAGSAGDGRAKRVRSAADFARVLGGPGGFMSEVLPEVMFCLPDWSRIESHHPQPAASAGKAGTDQAARAAGSGGARGSG